MRPEHFDGYFACLDSVARERKWLGVTQAPGTESVRQYALSAIASGEPFFVALDGVKVVGWCDIPRGQREGFTHAGTLGMGVLSDYRHIGVGKSLLQAAMKRAREAGLQRVELAVFASNPVAIKMYEKAGFVHEGVRRKGRLIDGKYDDLVLMASML
jgi:RimJ/RimL family protein N-acetyltransferase